MAKFEKDSLGSRMKEYENQAKPFLLRRTPVIIRVDGRAFHTFTKRCEKPFDQRLGRTMQFVAKCLVEGIQGAQVAYAQSDEVSVLVRDWDTIQTSAWFDYNLQKVATLSATIASNAFNSMWFDTNNGGAFTYDDMVQFDARAFNLPKEEVCNYFIWRQQDATRNSINMLAQSMFSHKRLQGKNTKEVQDMLVLEKGVNWNNCQVWEKRGACAYRVSREVGTPIKATLAADPGPEVIISPVVRSQVEVDTGIPIFTADRDFIERHLRVEEAVPKGRWVPQVDPEADEYEIRLKNMNVSSMELARWVLNVSSLIKTDPDADYAALCLSRGETWRPSKDTVNLEWLTNDFATANLEIR